MLKESKVQNQQSSFIRFEGVKPVEDSKKHDKQQFHKTKLLLSIYRTVVWRIESRLYEVQEVADIYGGKRISDLIDFLSLELDEYDLTKDKREVEERLMCISESKQIVNCKNFLYKVASQKCTLLQIHFVQYCKTYFAT